MTKFRITYRMENRKETAETCVDVPINKRFVKVCEGQHQLLMKYFAHELRTLLNCLAKLQGYTFTEICAIEEVKDGEY